MQQIDLTYNYGFQWHYQDGIYVKGFCIDKDNKALKGASLAGLFRNVGSFSRFMETIKTLNGIFAVIIRRNDEVFAAVDRLRNIPLLYFHDGNELIISDSIDTILNQPEISFHKDSQAIRFARSFGFTPVDQTLVSEIRQVRAGECLYANRSHLTIESYWAIPEIKAAEASDFLPVFNQTVSKLAAVVGDRPVALPLSGGLDSRLIGLMLKRAGKQNVTCFTFGKRSNPQARTSEKIARRLGYPWFFIDYSPYKQESFKDTEDFREYVRYFSNGISFPYLQEYFAGRYIRDNKLFPKDALFLPGHSGDMVGGSHFYQDMAEFKTAEDMAFKLYSRSSYNRQLTKPERKQLIADIVQYIGHADGKLTHQRHDRWNIEERQPKHIVNSSKAWNYFGYEYYLPLWENGFAEFFLSLPFSQRIYKRLYDTVVLGLFEKENLLLGNERTPEKTKQRAYYKNKLRETFPLINKIRPKNDRALDFFYQHELQIEMEEVLARNNIVAKTPVSVLTQWYMNEFFATFADKISE